MKKSILMVVPGRISALAQRIQRNLEKRRRYCDIRKGIAATSIEGLPRVVERSLQYTERLRINARPYGQYRYSIRDRPPLLYASVFAALLRHLTGDLEKLSHDEKFDWAEYVNSFQCQDGLFRDPLVANEIAETEDWWGWRHLTLHTLMALHALGAIPKRPLYFLEKVDSPVKVRQWLGTLDWTTRVSFTSNAVQNFGAAAQYARDFMGRSDLSDAINEMLTVVAERCDPRTGLWGSGFNDQRQALSEGVQTGYHFWLLFWYDGAEIPFPKRAFESILRLQNQIGSFSLTRVNTTACEDIDGLYPLVRLALRYRGLGEIAHEPVRKALRWILYNFNDDGGAVFQRDAAFTYGHPLMSSNPNECSIFATWFRLLSVAVACEFLETTDKNFGQIRWQFIEAPGLQFHPL